MGNDHNRRSKESSLNGHAPEASGFRPQRLDGDVRTRFIHEVVDKLTDEGLSLSFANWWAEHLAAARNILADDWDRATVSEVHLLK